MTVYSEIYATSEEACGEEGRSDESDSKSKRTSATKRSSKSRKSKESLYQNADSRRVSRVSLKTSDEATTSTCFSWFHRAWCLLLLTLLAVCGVTCSFMTFNDMLDGHVDSAICGSMKNEPR